MLCAGVMELADVSDSKSDGSDTVPVRPRSPAPNFHGLVAQLGERCVRNAEVEGSIPFKSTNVKFSRFAISRTRFFISTEPVYIRHNTKLLLLQYN